MKILIIEPCYENFGGYFRAFGISKALSEKGVYVDLLLSSDKKFDLRIRKKKINNNFIQYTLPRIYINYFITGRILRGLIACFFVLFKTYDVIHAFAIIQFESNMPFLVAKMLRKKVVIDWDDCWSESVMLVPLFKRYKIISKYLKFCEYKIQKLTANITVTSTFLQNEAKRIGIKNIYKIINGVNLDQFRNIPKNVARKYLKIKQDDKVLLSFGHTFFKDRALILFKIFEEILKLDKSVMLYFNYDPKIILRDQNIEKKINLDILKNIKNVGYINKNMLGYYLGACDLVLFCMGNYASERACFPTRIGTFLNGERIIVTNDTETEACNVLKKYQCAIIGEDPEDIAKRVIGIFYDKEQKKNIENNVKKAKEKLAWKNIIRGLLEFYNRLVQN